MGRISKIRRFDEMRTFPHVFEPDGKTILTTDFYMKGLWNEKFFGNDHPVVIELGCGKGEYTIELARKYPDRNYIGIDIKGARIWKGAREALDDGLTNVSFLRTRVEFLQRVFAPGEVNEIWVTFPDPQPQKPRKRLTSGRFLTLYNRFLKADSTVHLKTDSRIVFEYTLAVLELNGIRPEISTDNLYGSGMANDILSIRTYYESGYLEKGNPIAYLRFRLPGGMILSDPPVVKSEQ
ncbi:MAG: tRNA (guanosine(46)-N7)-methyltransferase TrmB [Bacteroidota bacterium]